MAAAPSSESLLSDLQKLDLVELFCAYCKKTTQVSTNVETMLKIFLDKGMKHSEIYTYAATPTGYRFKIHIENEAKKQTIKKFIDDMIADEREKYIIETRHWIRDVRQCDDTSKIPHSFTIGRIYGIPTLPTDKIVYYSKYNMIHKIYHLNSYLFKWPTVDQLIGLYIMYGHDVKIGYYTPHRHEN